MKRYVLVIFVCAKLSHAQGVITTIAGNGTNNTAGDGGPAISASLRPDGLAMDSTGNFYVADIAKSVIRKINAAGIITTVAGFAGESTVFSGDGGPATNASLYLAQNHNGLALDSAGNLYIADDGHDRIRKVTPSGVITTVAGNGKTLYSGDGGPATQASIGRPAAVVVDAAGNLYITDTQNWRVRKVDTNGIITTFAGTGIFGNTGDGGPATSATFEEPIGLALDGAGNLYIADRGACVVRKVDVTGTITTVAGNGTTGFSGDNGPATKAAFDDLRSVTVDAAGNLYLSDFGNNRLRQVDQAGIVRTIAGGLGGTNIGDGAPPTSANVSPADVVVDAIGNYYIADLSHNRIRKVTIGAKAPGLDVTARSLYFSAVANGNNVPASQVVTISTKASAPLLFALSTSGGNWLSANVSAGITPVNMTVSINISGLAAGPYQGTIKLTPNAPDLPVITIPVTLNMVATAPSRPAVSASDVRNAASYQPGVASNTLITIKGTNLASTTDTWDTALASGQLPTSLDGVTVLFNGKPGYPTFVSPTQINVLAPDLGTSTTASLIFTNSGAFLNGVVNVGAAQYGPAFFVWPNNQAVATRSDYSYAVKDGTFPGVTTVAAKPGDILILWSTGFGPTTPAVPYGLPVPTDATYSTSTTPTVTINNVSAIVYGAALAPGYGGLYQVAIQIPSTLSDGDWPIAATVGGISSPSGVVLSVKQ